MMDPDRGLAITVTILPPAVTAGAFVQVLVVNRR